MLQRATAFAILLFAGSVLATPLSAEEGDRSWSGSLNAEGQLWAYEVKLPASPEAGEDGYIIAQGPNISTCYVAVRQTEDTDTSTVLVGLSTSGNRTVEDITLKGCGRMGWVSGDELAFVIRKDGLEMEVFEKGNLRHTIQLVASPGA